MPTQRQEHPVQNEDELADTNDLIREYQQHPSDALQTELVHRFRPLVETLASKFSRSNETFEDIVQVGMIGLLAALRRFDENCGSHFESFAVPTIVGEIKRYMRDETWSVHVPRRVKELGPRIKKAVEHLMVQYQRSPQIVEIAIYLNVTEEEVLESMEMARSYNALSVDSPIEIDSEGNMVTLLDRIGNTDSGYEQIERQLVLNKAFNALNERERRIVQMTFFENLSQKQVGEALGISQMHVSRLQRRALHKLKNAIHLKTMGCI